MKNIKSKSSFFSRHRVWIILTIFVSAVVFSFVGYRFFKQYQSYAYQKSIEPFYEIPNPLPSTQPGYIIRSEKIDLNLPYNATAYRILYVTQLPDGQPAVSSGRIFVPSSPAPVGGRKVVAWAHGTLGFGDECAPSRNQNDPTQDMSNWLDAMMQRGWVVTATDYVGIGTKGEPYYLIGQSEANDVINSVRAARNFNPTNASNEFATWGHSQGGHSSLFSAQLASNYAPELKLVAASAAAPAAQLGALFAQQYSQPVAWAIGPDAAVSWPYYYKNVSTQAVLSNAGERNYQRLAYGCVMDQVLGIEARSVFKQQFFESNPIQNPGWYLAANAQTPDTSKIKVPTYIAQGLSDNVVLPNTTALFAQNYCSNNSSLTLNWFGNTTHTQIAEVSGPILTAWLQDRFNNLPIDSSCNQPLPVQPATNPPPPS